MSVELIIGIDVGTSGTGVAWCRKDASKVEFLSWDVARDIVKTPTRVFYNDKKVVGWGLKAPDHQRADVTCNEWFKLDLDQRADDVRPVYIDFLTCLYQEISGHYSPKMLGQMPWEDAQVHFLFSVPATWDASTVEIFRDFASAAGFDRPSGHTLDIGLTEPQAVAAFQLFQLKTTFSFQPGEVVLVVDAGGGTGDFCLLDVKQDQNGKCCAVELRPASGNAIGSIYIDEDFELKAKQELESLQPGPNSSIDYIAWNMRTSSMFQGVKHRFGCPGPSSHQFPVSDYVDDLDSPLRGEEFAFGGLDMQGLFHTQVKLLAQNIIRSASWLKELRDHNNDIDYVLLSGGLGSSAYVKQELQKVCAKFGREDHKVTKVVTSDDPRLSVCRGLVHNALRGPDLFPRFPCRAAFGVVCAIPDSGSVEAKWKPILKRAKKEGLHKDTDPVTGKEVYSCIDWILRKDKEIDNGKTIDFPIYANFPESTPPQKRIIQLGIVTSQDDNPSPFEKGGPRRFASMRVHLSRVDEIAIERPEGAKRAIQKMMETMRIRDSLVKVGFVIEAKIGLAHASFQCFDISKSKALSEPISFRVGDDQVEFVPFSTGLTHFEE
ncbi:hypothetical protein NCS52_01281900 [Fusarium sp. LHS14.1]|nr:hypothetical protein NCS52_01281900 [Fusarium sp. LHS14.1]